MDISEAPGGLGRGLMRCVVVTGTLKGFDQLLNLVLDDVKEIIRGTLFTAHPHNTSLTQK